MGYGIRTFDHDMAREGWISYHGVRSLELIDGDLVSLDHEIWRLARRRRAFYVSYLAPMRLVVYCSRCT